MEYNISILLLEEKEMDAITTRKVDELGRIVLPSKVRKALGIKAGSELQIECRNHEIVLKIPENSCYICGSKKELVSLDNSHICLSCIKKLQHAIHKAGVYKGD